MSAPMPHDQLIRLASDRTSIAADARRWFLDQGAAMARTLTEGLDDDRLGSVGHWRILLVLRELALPPTLPAILHAFRRALERRDPIVMPGALEALAAFDTADTAPAWSSLFRQGEPDDVNHGAALLGAIGDDRAVGLLTDLLTHERADARRSAVRALARIGTAPARAALRQHRPRETDAGVLSEMGEEDPT